MSEKMDFADGKYTVINDNGKLTALRHGEPWGRDLVGDNLVYWMLMDSLRLKEQRDALLEAMQSIADCCDEEHSARDYAPRQTEIRGIARAAIKALEEEA